MLSERTETQKAIPFILNTQNWQNHRESRLETVRSCGDGRIEVTANNKRVSIWGDEKFWNWIVMRVAEHC